MKQPQPRIMTTDNTSADRPAVLPDQQAEVHAAPDSDEPIRFIPDGILPDIATFESDAPVEPLHEPSRVSDFSNAEPVMEKYTPIHPASALFNQEEVAVDPSGVLDFLGGSSRPAIIRQVSEEDARIAAEESRLKDRRDIEAEGPMMFQRIVANTKEDFARRMATGDYEWVTPFDRTGKFGNDPYFVGSINGAVFRVQWDRETKVPRNIYEHMLNCGVVQAKSDKDKYLYGKKSGRIKSVQWANNPDRVMDMHQMARQGSGIF